MFPQELLKKIYLSILSNSKEIKIGALISYISVGFNILAGILYTPWMISIIGKSDYGIYILVMSLLSYFVMDFGLGQAIARKISVYKLENNQKKINELLGLASKFYLLISLIILIALVISYFFLNNIFGKLTHEEFQKLEGVYIISGIFSVISFPFLIMEGIFIAYERFIFLKLCDVISKIAIIVFMVAALFFGYRLYALVLINAIVGFLLIFVKFGYLFKNTPISINFSFTNKNVLKELMSFSFWTTIIGVGQRLLFNISPILLGILSGTSQIVFFSIGNIIEGYTWTIANALNGLFLSKVTHLESKENNLKSITDLMIKVGRMQLTIIGLLLVGLITLGKQFILLWMGEGYEPSYYIVLLLVLPGIITLTQEIAGTYLIVLNKLKIRAIIILLTSVLSVFISFFLAPKYGAIGCAIGIFIANLLGQVVGMNYVYWKVIKLEIPRFFKECFLSFIFPLAISIVFGFSLNWFFKTPTFLLFVFKAIMLGLFYILILWFFGLRDDEKKTFKSIFIKFLKK